MFFNRSTRKKRRDFLDPDFDFKASLKLASNQRSKCKINTDANSEIPELGLDAARLKLDCHLNPAQLADAAVRVAKHYNNFRNQRRGSKKSGSTIKRKRTKIHIDREYDKYTKSEEDD